MKTIVTLLLPLFLFSCDVFVPDVGTAGKPCTDRGLCLDGSACVEGTCVKGGDGEASEGTWTDSTSGLEWQNPPAESTVSWQDAVDYCINLSLDGGGWRVPTISELRSLIRGCEGTVTNGECGVIDTCSSTSCWNEYCRGCSDNSGPGSGNMYWPEELEGPYGAYWSSSVATGASNGTIINFAKAGIDTSHADTGYYVRCVRSGETPDGDGGEAEMDVASIWTDSSSGLEWQNPSSGSSMAWGAAINYCADLSLDGGGWHLPTISELRSLIRGCEGTETGGSCGVTDSCLSWPSCQGDSCSGCGADTGPADGCYWPIEMDGECDGYWSASSVEGNGDFAWRVGFSDGFVYNYRASLPDNYVRCVRSGGNVDGDQETDEERETEEVLAGPYYDSMTGLTWQNPPPDETMNWQGAADYCTGLGENWRMPTIGELRSVIQGCEETVIGGDCGVTDSCLSSSSCDFSSCSGCSDLSTPANGCFWSDKFKGTCNNYWSSSSYVDYSNRAWLVDFNHGRVDYDVLDFKCRIRCVK